MKELFTLIAQYFPVILTGSIFSAYWMWWNNRKNRQVIACAKFRSAVLAELGSIYPLSSDWPSDIDVFLRTRFTSLQTAVEDFKPFIPSKRRKHYERAWLVYRLGDDGREMDTQCYHQYMPFVTTLIIDGKQVTTDNSQTYKTKFKHNVENLLKYAEYK